jgi:hypothetical protein
MNSILRMTSILAINCLVLTGCGGSRESRAAAACEAAAKEGAQGKMLSVDIEALAKSATATGEDTLELTAPITLDTGLETEYKQTLNCRVQFVGNDLKVLRATFVF